MEKPQPAQCEATARLLHAIGGRQALSTPGLQADASPAFQAIAGSRVNDRRIRKKPRLAGFS